MTTTLSPDPVPGHRSGRSRGALRRAVLRRVAAAGILGLVGSGALVAVAAPATAAPSTFGVTATAFRLAGEPAANNVKLNWETVPGASGYAVYRNATKIASAPGNSFDDYDLSTSASYTYDVRAIGTGGTELAESRSASATTSTPTGTLKTYDNTTPSSLNLKATLQSGGTYYSFDSQSDGSGFTQVVQRTSTDGYSFTGSTVVLTRAQVCGSATPALATCKLESVNVVKDPTTGKFVYVAHFEEAGGTYDHAQILIAQATPGSPFTVTANDRPLGHDSRDISVFVDGADAYVLSATNTNADLNLYRLSADWSTVATLTKTLFVGQHREAPSLVKVAGTYFLFSSQAAGWYPSQPKYATATDLAGTWSDLKDIGNVTTFGTQSGWVAKVGERYAMMGSRWGAQWKYPEAQNSARMLPLAFNGDYASYDYFSSVDYDESGIVPVQDGRIVSVGKPVVASPAAAGYDAAKADDGTDDDNGVDDSATAPGNYYKPAAESVPFTWEVDLQQAVALSRVNLTTKLVGGSETSYSYTIDASLDRKTYTTVYDGTSNKAVGFQSDAITSTTPYRYVRITVKDVVNVQNDNRALWARGLAEVTVFGSPSSTPAPDTVATPTASVAAGTYYEPQEIALTTTTPGASVFYTTDGSIPTATHGTRYTTPIHLTASTTLRYVAVKDALVDSVVVTSAYSIGNGDSPVALVSPVYAAAYVGQDPNLPTQVQVTTAQGAQRLADVTWDLDGYSFVDVYRSLTVYGTVEGILPVSAQVEVVPASVVYFVDSGTAGLVSPSFEGVKSLAGPALKNQVSDQVSTSGGWGYVTAGRDGSVTPGTLSDKDSNGHYGKNAPSGEWLEYTLTDLPAGTYTLTTGHQEWWTGPRTMTVSVTNSSDVTSTIASDIVVGANASLYSRTRMASSTFVQTADGPVTVNVYRSGGSEGPVISWLAVATGAVAVDTTPVVVSTPTADVPAGTYKTAQSVTLSTTTNGASIYYTTDGSTPGRTNGTLYTGPVTIDEPATLKAIAFKNGLLSSVFSVAYDIQPVPADGYDAVPVGKTWYDTDGDPIQAHGGGFLQKDGWYYWVGENKVHDSANLYAVSLYRSKDLVNWEYVHDLVTASTPGICDAGTYHGTSCTLERPKLVYNEATSTYVLWGHWENGSDYGASHLVVATSPTIDGDYTVVRNFRPGVGNVTTDEADSTYGGSDSLWGYGSRDFTVFKDPDSNDAYLVSAQDHLSMRVYKLTADYTDVDWQHSYPLFVDQRREAPALVKVGSLYYVFTSSQSGWYPNQAMYSYTDDISDPDSWSPLEPVANNTTFYSQPTNIMTVQAENGAREYIYMGDRWNANKLGSSTYVWLPLDIDADDPTQVSMGYHPDWSLAADRSISYPAERLVSQGKPATASSTYDAEHPASAANDGNVFNLNTSGDNTNFFEPQTVPFSWTVDLEDTYDLSRVDLSFRSYNGSETYSGYTVSGSVDGNAWTPLATELANTTVGFKSNPLSGSYRYVRVDVANVVNDHNGSDAAWAAGLVEVQVYAKTADTTPPAVHVDLLPAPGPSGWVATAPTATVTASDPSGIESIEYRVDDGAWQAYTTPVTLTATSTSIEARATDKAGNVSESVSTAVRVDATAPTTVASLDAARRTVTLTATDGGSGVDRIEHRVLGSPGWQAYTAPVSIAQDGATLQYRAIDAVGNVEATHEIVVPPATTPPTTKATAKVAVTLAPRTKVEAGAKKVRVTATVTSRVPVSGTTAFTVTRGTKTVLARSVTVSQGRATLTVPKKKLGKTGTYRVTARYLGSATVAAASGTATLKVTKASAKVRVTVKPRTATARTGKVRVTVTVRSTVKVTGKAKVVLTRGGKTVLKKTVRVKNGHARLTVRKASLERTGKYRVTVRYRGSATVTKASGTASLRVPAAARR